MLRRFRCNYRGCLIVFNVLKAAWLRHFPCCAYIDGAVGRVGGDEFAVMIEEEMSQEVLEKELEQFFQNISGIQKEVTVSCSIGVYRFKYPKTIKELLTKTDEILYEAKANGRGCFVIR